MSQIAKTQTGGIIVWDANDWAAGLSTGVGQGGTPIIKSNKQNRTLSNIDPFRSHGFVAPGAFPAEATNSNILGGAIVAGVVSSNYTTVYGIDTGGKIHSYNQTTNTLLNSGGFPRTIAGTSPVGQDCIIYKHNSGSLTTQVFSLFYSYYNNANWDVGAYVNLTTFDDDFMSSVPTTPLDITSGDGDSTQQRTSPHIMCIGADDILYIGSGRYIHAYDGATGINGTFYSQVLSLPQGFVVTGLVKYDDQLLICGNYFTADAGSAASSGDALVYVWDYNTLDIVKVVPLKDFNVASMFIWRGQPFVITYGSIESRGQMRLKQIVGNAANKITDFNQSVVPVFRGVDSSNQVLYVNCGGNIVTVGSVLTDDGYEVNNITSMATSGGSGWFKIIPDNNLTYIASCSDGATSYKLSKYVPVASTGYQTGTYRSGFTDPIFAPGKMGRVKSVVVEYKSTVTPENSKNFILQLSTDFNQTLTTILIQTGVTGTLTKRYLVTDRPDNTALDGQPLPSFQNIALTMVWQNGLSSYIDYTMVSRVTVEYEELALLANT